MALPSSILPSTTAEVLAEQDALKASSVFRRLPARDLPSFIVSLTSKIANSPIDPKKLYARNTAARQTYYGQIIKNAKTESSLLILAIKYDKTDKLNSNLLRVEYLNRISHLVMIFMGKYNEILKDIPKTDIIANKLGKDVYFHLIKRLPSLLTLIDNPDQTESIKAFNDALYYVKSSILHPLTRFISLLLGELASSGSRPDIDKREFKREQEQDKKNLKLDFKKNKKFYKSKWSALRNEASATMSNLDIEASVSSNSNKTRDILNERRARIDNFMYSLEQGIQSINNNSFEGFVSAKVSIEDSLIEYSKRLEFRTLARKSRDIDEAFRLKNKAKQKSEDSDSYRDDWKLYDGNKKKRGSSYSGDKVHSVLKHLGPAGLAMYAGYRVINNPVSRFLIGKPLKYLGGKVLDATGFLAKAAGRKLLEGTSLLARTAFKLVGRAALGGLGLAALGLGALGKKVIPSLGRGLRKLGSYVASRSSTGSGSIKKSISRLADKAMYGAGYGVGSVVRGANKASGLLSKFLKNSFSVGSLASGPPSRIDPDTSGIIVPPPATPSSSAKPSAKNEASKPTGFPLELISRPLVSTTSKPSKASGFPLELISRATKLPRMKSGIDAPKADLYIDDILDRIDEHIPYIPADLTEQDFTLEDLKHVVEDALEDFLSGRLESTSKVENSKPSSVVSEDKKENSLVAILASNTSNTSKLSNVVSDSKKENSLVSIPASTTSKSTTSTSILTELKSEHINNKILDFEHESKLTKLLLASENIQEQLENLDKHLDILMSKKAKLNSYDESLISDLIATKEVIVEKTQILESRLSERTNSIKTIVTSVVDTVYNKLNKKTVGKTEDEIITENTTAREERSDRSKLIRAVEKLSKSRSRKSQSGGMDISSILAAGPVVSKAIKAISAVLGAGAGVAIKSLLPSIAKYAPRLAALAGPALAVVASAYAGWEVGSKLYDNYSTEIIDAIDSVIGTATDIVDGIKSKYDWLVGILKNPAEKLKSAGTKLSDWWDSNPISRGYNKITGSASKAATAVSEKVGQAKGAVVSGAKTVGSTIASKTSDVGSGVAAAASKVVDKVSTAASGAKTYVSDSVGKLFSTNHANVDFDNLDPGAKSSFDSMAKEYRSMGGTKPLSIESARRSTEKQAKLYAANPKVAAKPGRSLHERGKALDIDRATAGELESMGLLSKYGFARDVKGEPWHISYRGQSAAAGPTEDKKSSGTPKTPSAAVATSTPATSTVSQAVKPPTPSATTQEQPQTKTVSETSPTSTKPNYETQQPASPTTDKARNPAPTSNASSGSSPINTFSFLDSSFFIMNAGMMAS